MTTVKPSVEELLSPRYIIENEWFDCPYPVGTILVQQSHSNGFGPEMWIAGQYTFLKSDLDKYPYLTRELFWWEYHKAEEMPEYVKYSVLDEYRVAKAVFDLNETSEWFMYLDNETRPYSPGNIWKPATESDYLDYINSKNKI